jgi:hypothetical protein
MNEEYVDNRYVVSAIGAEYQIGNMGELKQFCQSNEDISLKLTKIRHFDFSNLAVFIPKSANVNMSNVINIQEFIDIIVMLLVDRASTYHDYSSTSVYEEVAMFYNIVGTMSYEPTEIEKKELDDFVQLVEMSIQLSDDEVVGGWLNGTLTMSIVSSDVL